MKVLRVLLNNVCGIDTSAQKSPGHKIVCNRDEARKIYKQYPDGFRGVGELVAGFSDLLTGDEHVLVFQFPPTYPFLLDGLSPDEHLNKALSLVFPEKDPKELVVDVIEP